MNNPLKRRNFIKQSAAVAGAVAAAGTATPKADALDQKIFSLGYDFAGKDSLCHGPNWETLNPGFWQIKGNALRRRLTNIGDRARGTGFPFHYANVGKKMPTEYDPSLPVGIIYQRDWNLAGDYSVTCEFTYRGDRPEPKEGDDPSWKMYRDGYGRMGVAFGAKSMFESYNKVRNAIQLVWGDDNKLRFVLPGRDKQKRKTPSPVDAPALRKGDKIIIEVQVQIVGGQAQVIGRLHSGDQVTELEMQCPQQWVTGFCGVVGQGLIDFEATHFSVTSQDNKILEDAPIECYTCYPLGDTLKEVDGKWQCRFISMFETDGEQAEIRIAAEEAPSDGWESVPVAGAAQIVNHQWRRNTAVIEATLPENPAKGTLFYTIWKDGKNVTADTRIGTASTGPGTGLVGDVPESGSYVGRLPQLVAPYKICGLSCHAITSGLQMRTEDGFKMQGGGDDWQFRDQPTVEAYKHLEDYNFQVMLWEDDVWYMELVLYPPSTDDAYKVVKHTICGPTSRWQMMRHWNVINPGDHDYGMDDVKGPEQLAIRRVDGLGQDKTYMQRNFQIVHHLITGEEEVDPLANPKKWRAWKMPNRDFTFVVLDSRLWRSSQDTDMWDDAGWDAFKNLYDRTDPTRSLLGEEQFAWLQRLLETDSSPLICLTGINGMHTIWAGVNYKGGKADHIQGPFDQRDRVAADYAGWVKAGADRVIELLGTRDGVVTVYGDVHNGCIMKNRDHGVIECSFGPIGRSGGRAVIPGFGPKMNDFDGRPVDVYSLYHKTHASPDLKGHKPEDPFYWNFLEAEFDPWKDDGNIHIRVRNMIDPPTETPRGGGELREKTEQTGRQVASKLAPFKTLANADVRFETTEGRTLRATRSGANGDVQISGFTDVEPGTKVIVTSHDGEAVESKIMVTS